MNMNGSSGSETDGGCSPAPVKWCCCGVILADGCPRYSSAPESGDGTAPVRGRIALCPQSLCLRAGGGDDTRRGEGAAGQERGISVPC